MSRRPTVLVLVACRDEGRALDATLDRLATQTAPPRRILVVDRGSVDPATLHCLALLGERGVGLLRGGLLAAVAEALAGGAEEAVLLLAAGDRLDAGFLDRMGERWVADPGAGFVAAATGRDAPRLDLESIVAGGGPHRATLAARALWAGLAEADEPALGPDLRLLWLDAVTRGLPGAVVDAGPVELVAAPRGFADPATAARALVALRPALVAPRSVEPRSEAVLDRVEERLLGLRGRQRELWAERWGIEAEIGALRREIDGLVAAGVPRIEWGDLRRTTPSSPVWGLDRGRPLDRAYVEGFLERHRHDLRGRVLEVKDGGYTRLFGGDRVERIDVLDLEPTNPEATLVGDLVSPDTLPPAAFDAIVLTQTLHLVRDPAAAVANLFRALCPGGVLLATVPATSRISYEDRGLDGDFWRFTEASLHALFGGVFPPAAYAIAGFGNVLAGVAFLHGLDPGELDAAELATFDPYFPLLFGVRAVKPSTVELVAESGRAAILLYHRVADRGGPGAIPPAAFRAQMEHLQRGYRLASLAEVATAAKDDRLAPRTVAVTFDDAYAELRELAPELAANGIPITVFAIGELVASGAEPEWETRRRAVDDPAEPPVRTLTADDLRRLAALPGIAVGSHGQRHLGLPGQPPAVQRDELRAGRATLEAILGRPVDALAYPFGEHDATSVCLARELGYRLAVTVEPRVVTPRSDPFRLPRLEVRHDDLDGFATWLAAFFR